MDRGAPRTAVMRDTASTTCSPFMPLSTSITKASRVQASTIVRARSRRQSDSASDKVHRPERVRSRRGCGPFPIDSTDVPARALQAQAEAVLPVKPVDPLVVDRPAFPTQQDVDPEIAIPYPRSRQIADAQQQRCLVAADRLVPDRRTLKAKRSTAPPFADSLDRLDIGDDLTPTSRRQSLFDSTSCRMCLSRLRSATSCFSFRFSSSSCFSPRSSHVPSPP